MEIANHKNVFVCWNSNLTDVDEKGSVKSNFDLVKDKIHLVHINELYREDYPWQELFSLLEEEGYKGFCLAEIPESCEPERLMKYYRALFKAYTG